MWAIGVSKGLFSREEKQPASLGEFPSCLDQVSASRLVRGHEEYPKALLPEELSVQSLFPGGCVGEQLSMDRRPVEIFADYRHRSAVGLEETENTLLALAHPEDPVGNDTERAGQGQRH